MLKLAQANQFEDDEDGVILKSSPALPDYRTIKP
jgi:hypothetical protein